MPPWLLIIGIGDDGLDGLAPAARALVESAEVVVGGRRHLAMLPDSSGLERIVWEGGVEAVMSAVAARRGRRVAVLATGDPMCYGVGATMSRRFAVSEMVIHPHPGAFELACARLAWSRPDVETLTIHGRPLEILNLYLEPGARLLVLSQDGESPAQVARLLTKRGFGSSVITVLEHLGGPEERRHVATALGWSLPRTAALNTLAIECVAGPDARILPRVPGLPDRMFEHDGQLTKREVRAVTVSALRPLLGSVLWDVGAGCGSVGIEWLRVAPRRKADGLGRGGARCLAIESNPARRALIIGNAAALGVPELEVIPGEAPGVLEGLEPRPNVVFVGGAVSRPGVLETCWRALLGGGVMVANGVTLEAQNRLFAFRADHGGELIRLSVSRAEPVGGLTGFRPLMDVVQYVAEKPRD